MLLPRNTRRTLSNSTLGHHDLYVYTYSSHCITKLSLTAKPVQWATNGDAVMSTVDLENGKQRLEDTPETLSGEKTSRKGESPKVEGLQRDESLISNAESF